MNTVKNKLINLYGPFNLIGRSLEVTTPSKQGDKGKTASIGNLGKTGNADIPMWDVAPDPCSPGTTLPHNGGVERLCDMYKDVVKNYPDINTKGFNTYRW